MTRHPPRPPLFPSPTLFRSNSAHSAGRRAGLKKQPHEVPAISAGVPRRYDLTNTVLSGGRDAAWRRATREALGARPGDVVLDVLAGTGVSTVELAAGGVRAVACDLSQANGRAHV